MEEVRNKDEGYDQWGIVSLLITCMQLALRLCLHAVRWTQKVLTQCWKTEKEKQTMTRKERRFQTLRERKKGEEDSSGIASPTFRFAAVAGFDCNETRSSDSMGVRPADVESGIWLWLALRRVHPRIVFTARR